MEPPLKFAYFENTILLAIGTKLEQSWNKVGTKLGNLACGARAFRGPFVTSLHLCSKRPPCLSNFVPTVSIFVPKLLALSAVKCRRVFS